MVIFQPVPICKGGFPRSISNGKSYCVLGCDPGDGNSGGIDADVTRDAAGQRNIWDLSYQKAQEIISNRQQEVMRNLKTYEEEYAPLKQSIALNDQFLHWDRRRRRLFARVHSPFAEFR